jgi:hypothetical protein
LGALTTGGVTIGARGSGRAWRSPESKMLVGASSEKWFADDGGA